MLFGAQSDKCRYFWWQTVNLLPHIGPVPPEIRQGGRVHTSRISAKEKKLAFNTRAKDVARKMPIPIRKLA